MVHYKIATYEGDSCGIVYQALEKDSYRQQQHHRKGHYHKTKKPHRETTEDS